MKNRTLLIGMIVITLAVVAAGVMMFSNPRPAFKGQVISPVPQAPDIAMTDARGNAFQLSSQRGKVVLMYFGFVNCPEECPLTMAHFKQAMEMLGADSSKVDVVMVSTDPARDTPQAMGDYLANFNPGFIGIPGTPEQLGAIWKAYDVQVLDGGETHSSYTYVIDRGGKIRLNFTPDSAPEDIVHDLKILLAED
jgi:protein SCO1